MKKETTTSFINPKSLNRRTDTAKKTAVKKKSTGSVKSSKKKKIKDKPLLQDSTKAGKSDHVITKVESNNQDTSSFGKVFSPEQGRPVVDLKPSRPYCIVITNTSESPQQARLFGHYEVNKEKMHPALIVKSGITGLDYRELLYGVLYMPFLVGSTYVTVKKIGNSDRVDIGYLTVESKSMDGTMVTVPMYEPLNPYQFQDNIKQGYGEYSVDGLTTLLINVPPLSVMSVLIYPKRVLNNGPVFFGQQKELHYKINR